MDTETREELETQVKAHANLNDNELLGVIGIIAERDALKAKCEDLERLIKECEWTGSHGYITCCPSCRQHSLSGHAGDCKLDAAIAKATGQDA